MRKFAPRLLTILLCFFLSACFETKEEIWIEADGSGRATFCYTIPASALVIAGGAEGIEERVRDFFASQPDLRLDELLIETRGSDTAITLTASTESMLSLLDLQKSSAFQALPGAAKDLAGTFDIQLKGLEVQVSREVNIKRALGFAAFAISGDQRRDRHLLQIIHLPSPAKFHNATRTENDGRTLIWDYSLGDALEQPILSSFQMRIPLPWWVIPGITLLLGLIIAALLRWRRQRIRARQESEAQA